MDDESDELSEDSRSVLAGWAAPRHASSADHLLSSAGQTGLRKKNQVLWQQSRRSPQMMSLRTCSQLSA